MEVESVEGDFTKFLPEEVIYTIFAKLRPVDLCKVASVSTEWRRFCRDAQLWREHVFENNEFRTICEKRNLSPDSLINWGDYYRDRVLINRRIQTGKPTTQTVLRGHSDTVFCTKFITETRVVTAGADASVRFWDINKTTPELQIPQVGILGLAYDHETKRLATGSFDGGIIVSNVNFDKREQLNSFSIRELKDVLKGKNIDFSDCFEKSDLIRKIEATKAIPLVETIHNFQCNNSVIAGLHIQNNFLASGSRDACVRLWNLTTGACSKILRQHRDAVNAVQMFDNCSKLYSSANDATILLWDVESGKYITKFTGHQGWIWGLQYDPATQILVSCSVDGSIRIWDPRTAACQGTLANGREVAGISVDYNANRIVSGSFDSVVRLWDLRTYRFYASLTGHKDRCTRVDATENVIASASFDGTAILYHFK